MKIALIFLFLDFIIINSTSYFDKYKNTSNNHIILYFRTPPPRFPMRGPPQGAKAPGQGGAART